MILQEAVVTGMGKIQDQYIALARLEDFQRKGTDVPTILFNSIPTPEFSMYSSQTYRYIVATFKKKKYLSFFIYIFIKYMYFK